MKNFLRVLMAIAVFFTVFISSCVAENNLTAEEAAILYEQFCAQQAPNFLYNSNGNRNVLRLFSFIENGGKISKARPDIDEQRFAFTICFEGTKFWSSSAYLGDTEQAIFCKFANYLGDRKDLLDWAYKNEPSCWVYLQGMLAEAAEFQSKEDEALYYCQKVVQNAYMIQSNATDFSNALCYSVELGYMKFSQKFFVEEEHIEQSFELSSESPASLLNAQFITDMSTNSLSLQEHSNYCLSLIMVGLPDEADKYAAQICDSNAYVVADNETKARILSLRAVAQHVSSSKNNKNAIALLEDAWNLCPEDAYSLRLEIGTRQIAIIYDCLTEENASAMHKELEKYFRRMKDQPLIFGLDDEHSNDCYYLFYFLYRDWTQYSEAT